MSAPLTWEYIAAAEIEALYTYYLAHGDVMPEAKSIVKIIKYNHEHADDPEPVPADPGPEPKPGLLHHGVRSVDIRAPRRTNYNSGNELL